jgi:hypothetical protein
MNHFEDSTQEEYAAAAERPTDAKGRLLHTAMTDREIAEEVLVTLRALADVLEAVGQSPMAAAMMPGLARISGK